MSDRQLIINSNISETRIALLEDSTLSELFIDRNEDQGIVGNIYKGKIVRVLPGIQSAFIDIGVDRTAFLHTADVSNNKDDKSEKAVGAAQGDNIIYDIETLREKRQKESFKPIEKVLSSGQEIMVQVTKDPIGTKGARLTMYLSIPGRYVVLIPNDNHIAISRKIEDEETRTRLIDLIKKIKPNDVGVIIRTAAAEMPEDEHIEKDLNYLLRIWKTIKSKKEKGSAPCILYQEPEIPVKITRELYSEDITRIVIDNKIVYDKIHKFLNATVPGSTGKLELYSEPNPIFDELGIEIDIAKALNRKAWLPSGGYLVIDQTEALTSFDVNTGKFVGKFSVQDTILKTNLEAVEEIVNQIKIRNIGGIIIIDFIDMDRAADREQVYQALETKCKSDKARTNVLKINELGLVHMTRKRTSESLEHKLMDTCPCCDGRGQVRSSTTLMYDLIRDIVRNSLQNAYSDFKIKIRSDLKNRLESTEQHLLKETCKKHKITVHLEENDFDINRLSDPPYEILPNIHNKTKISKNK